MSYDKPEPEEEKQVGLTDYQVSCKIMFFSLIKCALLYYKEFWPAEHQLFIDDIDTILKDGNREARREAEKHAPEKVRTNENTYLNFEKKIKDYLDGFNKSLQLVEGSDKQFADFSGFIHETLRRCFVVKNKHDFVVMIDMLLEGMFKEPFEEMKKLKMEALKLSEDELNTETDDNGKDSQSESPQDGAPKTLSVQSSGDNKQDSSGGTPPGQREGSEQGEGQAVPED